MEPLDPLDESTDTKYQARKLKSSLQKPLSPKSIEESAAKVPAKKSAKSVKKKSSSSSSSASESSSSASESKIDDGMDGLTLDQKILLGQAEILRTLPLDFFLSFRNICEQLVPRLSVYALTFHVILLIPVIRIVKFQLNASIYPFIYIGPVLFLIPYLLFWLWENDVTNIPVFDNWLLKYVKKQKDGATKTLEKEKNDLMVLAKVSNDADTIKKLSNLILMSTIDTEMFISEIISIKKRIKGRADKNPPLSTFSQDNAIFGDNKINVNDDVNSAVKTLIETSLLGEAGENEKSLLEKLKQLQKDLDKSA